MNIHVNFYKLHATFWIYQVIGCLFLTTVSFNFLLTDWRKGTFGNMFCCSTSASAPVVATLRLQNITETTSIFFKSLWFKLTSLSLLLFLKRGWMLSCYHVICVIVCCFHLLNLDSGVPQYTEEEQRLGATSQFHPPGKITEVLTSVFFNVACRHVCILNFVL